YASIEADHSSLTSGGVHRTIPGRIPSQTRRRWHDGFALPALTTTSQESPWNDARRGAGEGAGSLVAIADEPRRNLPCEWRAVPVPSGMIPPTSSERLSPIASSRRDRSLFPRAAEKNFGHPR